MIDQAPEDEKIAPEWMTKEFFQKILKQKDDTIEITDLVTKPGIGDHYASVMFKADITYNSFRGEGLETSFIIKTMPFVDGPKKDILEKINMFRIENRMYEEVIPKIQKVLKEAGDDTQLACECLYSSLTPHKTLVFEDLTKKNFRPPNNVEDNMFDVASQTLEKLAKWHAVSYKLNADNKETYKDFHGEAFKNFKFEDVPFFRDGFPFFLEMLEQTPDFEVYVPKLQKLIADNILHKATRGFRACNEGHPANIFVLNHGDAHLKNTMIRDEDGKLDILLIDFQLCNWGPAVMDLIYFLYMAIDAETRATKRDEIIQFYFKAFTKTLKNIGYERNIPQISGLYKDFETYKYYELMCITTLLPLACGAIDQALAGQSKDVGDFLDDEDIRKQNYYGNTYQTLMRQVLPELLEKGFLE